MASRCFHGIHLQPASYIFFTENREMLLKIQSWRWWNFFWGWILDQWFLSILRGRLPLPSLYILYFPYNLFYLVNFFIDRITGLGWGAGTQTLEASDCLSSLDDGTLQRVNLIKTGGTPYKLIFIPSRTRFNRNLNILNTVDRWS